VNVVIDTNVFVSSFLSLQGPPKRVIDLWKTGRIILCLSRDIIAEYVEVLARFGLAGQPELRELLDLFARRVNIIFVPAPPVLPVIPDDPADEKFIACAVAAKAECVVSGDKHLLNLGAYGAIKVVTPSQFVKSFSTHT
jgi:putative PIN family toxin of toxin-antitoxin system